MGLHSTLLVHFAQCSPRFPVALRSYLEHFVEGSLAHAFVLGIESQLVTSFSNYLSVLSAFSQSLDGTSAQDASRTPSEGQWCHPVSEISTDADTSSPGRAMCTHEGVDRPCEQSSPLPVVLWQVDKSPSPFSLRVNKLAHTKKFIIQPVTAQVH